MTSADGLYLWGDNDVGVWELDFAYAQDFNFPQLGAGDRVVKAQVIALCILHDRLNAMVSTVSYREDALAEN